MQFYDVNFVLSKPTYKLQIFHLIEAKIEHFV